MPEMTISWGTSGWYIATSIATFFTMGILVWYTYETYLLRKAAQAQLLKSEETLRQIKKEAQLSLAPLLMIGGSMEDVLVENRSGEFVSAVIRNLGRGAALNLEIPTVCIDGATIEFLTPAVVPAQSESRLSFRIGRQGESLIKRHDPTLVARFIMENLSPTSIEGEIRYCGVSGDAFSTRFEFGVDGNKLHYKFLRSTGFEF